MFFCLKTVPSVKVKDLIQFFLVLSSFRFLLFICLEEQPFPEEASKKIHVGVINIYPFECTLAVLKRVDTNYDIMT